ncbi:hypothetical protein AVEN_269159-1 [Araneus ventricosus]|uniref:Uncharacterized protein n=1 Tax=Araneus ventricosus TaxID=182803 RepID=A0A4Y2F1U5_ARAVE|nr:hypothetical protein AVEN_269159-1 [Araneus ventricosus]
MWRQRPCFVYVQFTPSSKRFANSSSKKYITPLSGFKQSPFPHSRNTANARNFSPHCATSSTSIVSCRSSNLTSTTRPVATSTNESHNINCVKTNSNTRDLIPDIINKITEVQDLCDPCSDITVIQQSCVPDDSVIQPCTDGEFLVVDHAIRTIG